MTLDTSDPSLLRLDMQVSPPNGSTSQDIYLEGVVSCPVVPDIDGKVVSWLILRVDFCGNTGMVVSDMLYEFASGSYQ